MLDAYKKEIDNYMDRHRSEFLRDLAALVAIDSTCGIPQPGMPYGKGPAEALAAALALADSWGLYTENWKNHLGIVELAPQESNEGLVRKDNAERNGVSPAGCADKGARRKLDIFVHLDVVPAGDGWTKTEPFCMREENGLVYGRGTADDKGPALCALYALRAVKELQLPIAEAVRVVLGCDEEIDCRDLDYYMTRTDFAEMSISPDAEYPVINLEKGCYDLKLTAVLQEETPLPRVVQIAGGTASNVVPPFCTAVLEGVPEEALQAAMGAAEMETGVHFETEPLEREQIGIRAIGVSTHASTPEQGQNANTAMLALLAKLPLGCSKQTEAVQALHRYFPHGDMNGKACRLYMADEKSGEITVSLDILRMDTETLDAEIDARTPLCADMEKLSAAERLLEEEGFQVEATYSEAHYVPEDTALIRCLLDQYETYFHEPGQCVAMGGGTYVHHVPGGVAFGCALPGIDNRMHGPDEFADVQVLMKSAGLFACAIAALCGRSSA